MPASPAPGRVEAYSPLEMLARAERRPRRDRNTADFGYFAAANYAIARAVVAAISSFDSSPAPADYRHIVFLPPPHN